MDLHDFIKDLSLKDKKTLSQKTLKLVEEVGELSRVILPYDSAHGTNHRFIDKEAILEELVDVYLTNISILHSLEFTNEEFEDMLSKKTEKWSKIQINEDKGVFPLPFEIHITVDGRIMINENQTVNENSIQNFKDKCQEIGVKPIVLDLEINDGSTIKDVMTSSKHFGDNRTAYEEAERIANGLEKSGYVVLRKKIETVPWHPAAPTKIDKEIPNGCYFESHIGVLIDKEDKKELNIFINHLNKNGLTGKVKLSQNFFKKSKDNSKFVNMVTYRSNKCPKDTFIEEVEFIKNNLNKNNFNFEKVEVEYAVYDTNVTHDLKWINS